MPSNRWLTLAVLFCLISGYCMQTHIVSDEDDESVPTFKPTNSNPGIKDTDGYCIFEEK